jgi:CHAT domain-containing protein/uncharacterized protein HemY
MQVWSGLVAGMVAVGQPAVGMAQERPNEQVMTGQLTEESDRLEGNGVYYRIHQLTGRPGSSLLITLESEDFDAVLVLVNAAGNGVAEDDNSGGGTNARFAVRVPDSGEIAIAVTTKNSGAIGRYRLRWEVVQARTNRPQTQISEARRLFNQAGEQHQVGNYQAAVQLWKRALVFVREVGNRENMANILGNLGSTYDHHLEEPEQAVGFYTQAIAAYRELGNQERVASLSNNLGVTYRELGQYDEAIAAYETSLNGYRELRDREWEANILGNLGVLYGEMNEPQKQIEMFEQSAIVHQEIGELEDAIILFGDIGETYRDLEQYERAIRSYQNALKIAQEIGDRDHIASLFNSLGITYKNLGQYDQAIAAYEMSLNMYRELRDQEWEANVLENLGVLYGETNEPQKQIEVFEQSVIIYREIGDREGEALAAYSVGIAHYELDQNEQAIPFFEQSLKLQQEIGDRAGSANALNYIGISYRALRDYEKSIGFHQQALAIWQELDNPGEIAQSLTYLGNRYNSLEQYEKSIEFHQQALEIREDLGDRDAESRTLQFLISAHAKLNQIEQAINFFEQRLAILEVIGTPEQIGNEWYELGKLYGDIGDYEKSLEVNNKALAIAREIGERQLESYALNHISIAYKELEQYERAIEFQEQSIAIKRELGDRRGELNSLHNLASVYFELEQYEQAIIFEEQALALAENLSNQRMQVNALRGIARANRRAGKFGEYLDFSFQALKVAEAIGDDKLVNEIEEDVKEFYAVIGFGTRLERQEEITFHEENLRMAREKSYPILEALALESLAMSYSILDQPRQAIDHMNQALSIQRELGDIENQAWSLSNLGNIYRRLGDRQKSLEFHELALNLVMSHQNLELEIRGLINLGITYGHFGDSETAIQQFEEGLRKVSVSNLDNKRKLESDLNFQLGLRRFSDQKYEEARQYLEISLQLYREIEDREGEAETLELLGLTYWRPTDSNMLRFFDGHGGTGTVLDLVRAADEIENAANDRDKAIAYFNEYLEATEGLWSRNPAFGDRSHEIRALSLLAASSQDKNQSIQLYREAIDIARSSGDYILEIRNTQGLAKLLPHSEAEMLLREAVDTLENVWNSLGDDDLEKVTFSQSGIASGVYQTLQQVLIAQEKYNEAFIIAEQGRTRALTDLLASRLPQENTESLLSGSINLEQIKQVAREQNATLVQYSVIDDYQILMWVVQPNGEIHFRSFADSTISMFQGELVSNTREALNLRDRGLIAVRPRDGSDPKYDEATQLWLLHRLLIEPIADLLPTDPEDRVIFVPHRELFFVPFAALMDEDGNYLIEKHTILTAPSIRVLDTVRRNAQAQRNSNGKPLVVGNPTMPEIAFADGETLQLSQLPGAEREAIAIADLLGTKPLLGADATKAAVLEQFGNAPIIHLATHGLLEDFGTDVPGAIALAPSGRNTEANASLLRASELLQLDQPLNAELVVLSACDTGRGDLSGDGVIGLSRSFISAGVPSLLVSLWAVPDAPTAELMTEFYRQRAATGDNAQALRQAMLQTMRTHPEPRNWAAFTLIGEAD